MTWSRVYLTLGATTGLGWLVLWVRMTDGDTAVLEAVWTLGFLALAFALVSLQLRVPVWFRRWAAARSDAPAQGRDHWVER